MPAGRPKLTNDDFVARLPETIRCLDEYRGFRAYHNFECLTCGHVWSTVANCVMAGNGCVMCWRSKLSTPRTTAEQHAASLPSGIAYVSGFTKMHGKATYRCEACNHSWSATPMNVVRGTGCPVCAVAKMRGGRGVGTSKICTEWLDLMESKLRWRIASEVPLFLDNRAIRLDGLNNRQRIAFEFLGWYWHSKFDPSHAWHVKTLNRFNALLREGYAVVYVWEDDYKAGSIGKLVNPNRSELIARRFRPVGLDYQRASQLQSL